MTDHPVVSRDGQEVTLHIYEDGGTEIAVNMQVYRSAVDGALTIQINTSPQLTRMLRVWKDEEQIYSRTIESFWTY